MSQNASISSTPCPYCDGVQGIGGKTTAKTPFDIAILSGAGVVIAPTVGMMVPGYFLAITERHVSGFCSLEREALIEVETFLNKALTTFGALFDEYLVFEHGTSGGVAANGSCISHAHFHLIPYAKTLGPKLLDALDFLSLERFSDLRQIGCGYAFLGFGGRYYYSPAVNLPGQWVRRQFARVLGSDRWDWGVDAGNRELEETLNALRAAGTKR